ncbi:MAG: nitroreductase family protein, partial [Myxococcota bacterium]
SHSRGEKMEVHEALYTTRAMRRVKPDPVPRELQARILDAAIRAPSGGNSQGWRFMLVDDKEVIGRLAPVYQECLSTLFSTIYKAPLDEANAAPEDGDHPQFLKMYRSAKHMGDHFAGYPLLLLAFSKGDPGGGSIFPAVWNAMLAARAEGVGSAITSVLLFQKDRMFEILGVPADQGWNFACLVPMGYPTGRWGIAPRRPVHEVSYRNQWGEPIGFEVNAPLWPRE